MPCRRSRASRSRWRTSLRRVPGRESPSGGVVRRAGRRQSPGFRGGRPGMAQKWVEPASQQTRVREILASRSESYRPSPPRRGWRRNGPSDYQKSVERTASSPRTAPTIGTESDQLVNICSFAVRCDRRWPSTHDIGFILVQATCPTSGVGRSVTLFLSPGARSL